MKMEGKLAKAKEHLDMAKKLVEDEGMGWEEFMESYEGPEESSDMPEEGGEDEDMGNAKKRDMLIIALKKKRGME